MRNVLHTIGHSTHSAEGFCRLLRQHCVDAIADVRSTPYSRHNPQFNREVLRDDLSRREIAYVFLGAELGGRSADPNCYVHGKIQYEETEQRLLREQGLQETDLFSSPEERLGKAYVLQEARIAYSFEPKPVELER